MNRAGRVERVLLVDDDASVREALGQTLELAHLVPTLAGSYIESKDHITPRFEGVIVSDIRMPGKDGFALLEFAQSVDAELPVILLTGRAMCRWRCAASRLEPLIFGKALRPERPDCRGRKGTENPCLGVGKPAVETASGTG